MSRMASFIEWEQFLRPLAVAVRNQPTREDFKAKCAACADSLAIPAEWLTPHRRREVTARFEFFPSVREVDEFFADEKRHVMEMATLTSRVGYLPAPEPAGPLSPEQVEVVMEKVAQLRKDLAATITRDAPKAEPRYLNDIQLLAAYERLAAQGNQACAFRAAQLRKQMGGVT